MKVAIFSHAHPIFSKGGGELAAYYLWKGINESEAHQAWFIGRAPGELMHKFSSIASVGEHDYIMAGNAGIPDLTATIPLDPDGDLAQLLKAINPDVVHFHHYVHVGIEVIRLVKNVCPNARIVLTLHEFIAICMNNGQMVKTNGELCHRYSPRECHLCFPHVSPEDFFLREQYIKSFFKLVDIFISPSHFLEQRYTDWGLNSKIHVLENGLPEDDSKPLRELRENEVRGRFAYFGQINPYKGVDIILDAFAHLPKKYKKLVTLDIFGSGLANQTPDFHEKVKDLLNKNKKLVRLHGPYEPHEMGRLMGEVDWVIMGSIWWENSPLVIQEAYKYKRPVICPDIGGMAEKVIDGIGGIHYRARDSISLVGVLSRIVDDRDLFNTIYRTLPKYSTLNDITNQHLQLYDA